jgi:lipopolysaccharide export system permease protein
MQFEFFPSRTLTLYIARLFIVRVVGVAVLLVVVLQMLDLLTESGKILAFPGNGQAELLTYLGMRAPQLIAFVLPYSVLLSTIVTLFTLNQNSEVVSMKAAGLSAHQVLAPLLLTAFVVAVTHFAFNERIVTRASATLKAWQDADYGPVPQDSGVRSNVYLLDGNNILMAATVTGRGKAMVMQGVSWYRRDAQGMVLEQIVSPRATFADPGWRLESPRRFDVATTTTQMLQPLVIAREVDPAQITLSTVDPDAQNIFELADSIAEMRAAGRRTAELEGKWWHKISGPLSAVLMPLLGAMAAFGLARSGQVVIRAVIGMALGFTYFVFDNAALAMGNFGGYPPLLAAWAPFVLFTLVGETVLIRTEE